METKFIEGTNEQYSIREDGVVIRHWGIHSSGSISNKEKILKGYFDKKTNTIKVCINNKEHLLKTLMGKYFNIKNPYDIDVPLCYKDNNSLNCSLNNLYYRKPKEKTPIEYYHNSNGKYNDRMVTKLSRSYIAHRAGIKTKDLTNEHYIFYKQLIILKRKLNIKN
jgi:hypothetical protein